MSDVRTTWVAELGRGDWTLEGASLASGDDLVSAVLISLFTNRRARTDDALTDGTVDRRGWWGDLGRDVPIGSRLWLLERAKQSDETLARARDYIAEALQWLTADGVAARVEVDAQWAARGRLEALVTIHRTSGATVPLRFAWAWAA